MISPDIFSENILCSNLTTSITLTIILSTKIIMVKNENQIFPITRLTQLYNILKIHTHTYI